MVGGIVDDMALAEILETVREYGDVIFLAIIWDVPEGGGVKYLETAYLQYRWARSLHASMDSERGLFRRRKKCDGGEGVRCMRMEEALREFNAESTMRQTSGMHLRKGFADFEGMETPVWHRSQSKWITKPLYREENKGMPWTREVNRPTKEPGQWRMDRWEEKGYEGESAE